MNQKSAQMDSERLLCNISWLRKKHGLSKRKMADIMGIGIESINKIERMEMPPRMRADVLNNLYDYFHIRPSHLLSHRLGE